MLVRIYSDVWDTNMCLPDCPLFFDVELIVKRENVKKKIGSQSYPTVSA